MTGLIVKIKHRFPTLWSGVERINAALCSARYPQRARCADEAIAAMPKIEGYTWSRVNADDADNLARFFERQSADRLSYFRPHAFDAATLRRMATSGGFVMMKVTADSTEEIAGYHFLRLFFNGSIFHGLIVDPQHGGRGLGKRMWQLGAEIADALGSAMQATISEANAASLASCRDAVEVTESSPIDGGYLHLTLRPRRS